MSELPLRRVLMSGDTVGGVWTFTLELARAMGESGVEVILAAFGGEATPEQRAEAAQIPNLRLHSLDYKLEWMDDPWEDVEVSGRWLLEIEKRHAPDVIHLNSYGHGSLPWAAPVILTAHSCVLSWWNAVRRSPAPQSWTRYRCEVEYALKNADLITAPSRAMLRTLEENYGVDLPVCRVVPNGRSQGRYSSAAKEPVVLSAGRLWDQAKNVAAVARVAERLPWPVYLAGDCRHPNGGESQFPRCHSLGRLSHEALAAWYGRAAIYALPARYEPFGLSALEAALSGCALVLGDIESLREVWEDAAVYVPPDDESALEGALRELMEDASHRDEMARRSAARAREFTPERMASGYLDAYRSAVERRRAACVS